MSTENDSSRKNGCSHPAAPRIDLERRIGRLEVVALVLELLERVDDIADVLPSSSMPSASAFISSVERPAISDTNAGAVADCLRIDVLVGVLARLSAEVCRLPCAERQPVRLRVDREVRARHMVGNRGEVGETPLRQTLDTHLELEVGHDRHEVTVADPFAITVDRALHLGAPARTAARALATPQPVSLWRWMPTWQST